ncbi:MAG: CsgG/HfaB family protein [candidate division Zixibacteria bacterium]|nr:CsgG/HfaB family protein [candidate division Zixibacteria bacterium]
MESVRKGLCFLMAVLLLPVMFGTAAFAGDDDNASIGAQKRVIVGTFRDKSSHSWYRGSDPGTGMADMLISALVKSGKFKVYARDQLDEILAEKNLSMSDLANPGVNVQNKLDIGDYLVSASITEFGYKEKRVGGSKLGLGKLGYTEYTGRMAVDLQLIDLGSSEILFADNVDKSEKSRSLGVGTDEFSFASQNRFDEHVVGKATRKTINAIVDILAEKIKPDAWAGGYLIVSDDIMFVEAGSEMGIKVGTQFKVKRVKQEVKNREGKVIKVLYEDVGVVEVTEVEEGLATCKAVSGSGFMNDDIVSPMK